MVHRWGMRQQRLLATALHHFFFCRFVRRFLLGELIVLTGFDHFGVFTTTTGDTEQGE